MSSASCEKVTKLSKSDIGRYSRQLILPEIGVAGQLKLVNASVLVVGAGGLGCPAAIYLAAAGIGRIGVVDHDVVETNNLHRQVLHSEHTLGCSKAKSLADSMKRLNSNIQTDVYEVLLKSDNAIEIISKYDVVLDATDNVPTRYLLNDACVLTKTPLVSGSALRFEGQLTVYNHGGGPCYRCLFPDPPPPQTVTNCSDGGVIGPVPGMIGTLQALETIKILSGLDVSYSGKLLLFDGLRGTFRVVTLRSSKDDCRVCGKNPSIKQLVDYEVLCGAAATDKDKKVDCLDSSQRISCKDYCKLVEEKDGHHLLVDVRETAELQLCELPGSFNLPMSTMETSGRSRLLDKVADANLSTLVVVCRRGNDSQLAVLKFKEWLAERSDIHVCDIRGGLHAWAAEVDPHFPVY